MNRFRPVAQAGTELQTGVSQFGRSFRFQQQLRPLNEGASFVAELRYRGALLNRPMTTHIVIDIQVLDQLTGLEVGIRVEVGWTERGFPFDVKVDAPLNGVTTEQHSVPSVENSEVPFAVTRQMKYFDLPIGT